jgi:Tfp pilus assembly pilus retraction ATPase PilT
MKDHDIFQKYRLRRHALDLEAFTVNELRAVAGTERETIEGFIFNLKQEIPGAFTQETVKANRVGRPLTRYRLTPEAIRRLAAENTALGMQLSVSTHARMAPIQIVEPTVAPQMAVPGENVESWLTSLAPSFTNALDEGAMLTVKPAQAVTAQRGNVTTLLADQLTFTMDEIVRAIKKLLTPWQYLRLEKQGWTAGSYTIKGHAPVYLQVETEAGKPTLKVRPLATHIPTTEELRLPALAEKISTMKAGLILVTGIVGSGRSKVMAALVNGINIGQSERIATIEEPLCYFYPKSKSYLEQKQVAIDSPDFGHALELALRNDADVVALSDISDPNTFSTVLEAAERKVLFCRISASAPAEAIRKMVGLFPETDQPAVRSRLAQNLAGIISVKGLPAKSGEGTVVAAEVLQWRRELREVIVDPNKTVSISEAVATYDARESLVDSVENLYKEGLISQETLTRHSSNH